MTRWWMLVAIWSIAAAGLDSGTASAQGVSSTPPTDLVVARRVIISLLDRQLAVLENDVVISVFPVAVGAARSPSPVGTFTVVNRIPHPTYYRPGKIVQPGASNPLGTRWVGLSHKGYGIHGTNNPKSIGHARSHGCIRMRNRDVEQLFERLRVGDRVELHDERTPELERLFVRLAPLPARPIFWVGFLR